MFPDAGPTARALIALEALQARPGITAAELAGRLGVSERAARRSIDTLRLVGVPVEATRGPHGGYRLGRGLRLPPLVFSATEALGLVMAVLDGDHAAADPADPVGAAIGKLIGALPENVGRQAALMRAHAASAPDRRAARPNQGVTGLLVAAVASARTVEVDYRTEKRAWSEEVDPWALVVRYGRWYLLCHSHRADDVRTYRVDRVEAVRETGAGFTPPADLDSVAMLEEHLSVGWEHPVRVVFDAPVEEVAPWVGASMGRLSEHPDDPARALLVGSTNNPESYAGEWLAAMPFGFTIEGGDAMRDAMAAVIARLRASLGEGEL